MFGHLRDSVNPRGAEYGATSRAARASTQAAENTEDLLELELADAAGDRYATARRIRNRRSREGARRAWWHRLDLVLSLLFVVGVAAFMLSPDKRPVTHDARGGVSQVTHDALAPVRAAQSSAITAAVDRAIARGDVDPTNPDIVYLSNADYDMVAKLDNQ